MKHKKLSLCTISNNKI